VLHDVKLLNRILWGVNVLLGAGIVVFSIQYLLRAQDAGYLKDLKRDDDSSPTIVKAPDPGDGALKSLSNPVEKRERARCHWIQRPSSEMSQLYCLKVVPSLLMKV